MASLFENYRVIDLSPKVVANIKRVNSDEYDKGSPDPIGENCWLEEHIGGEGTDHTMSTSVGMSGHTGAHTEGSKGHITHWEGCDKGLGLWEYPLETFYGPAAVCDFSSLKPGEGKLIKYKGKLLTPEGYKHKGQAITPDHLSNVRKGDIVLMWSPYMGIDSPYIPSETAEWFVEKEIKGIAIQLPGVMFDTVHGITHRILLENNITITYPLINLDKLKSDRTIYMGLPMHIDRMEATWIRAIALEEK